jgi:hypothetical protein
MMSGFGRCRPFYIEIRNNTSGRSMLFETSTCPMRYERGVGEIQTLSHRKLGGDDPTFDNGDDVSISVLPLGPAFQVKAIGVQWLHEEEGNDDDIQSKDEVINAHNSSDDDDDDAAHVAKFEIASRIFRNYYCAFHGNRNYYHDGNIDWWYFAKRGLELVTYIT